jgi:prepilin-type processing-associated H-X9-DG protein
MKRKRSGITHNEWAKPEHSRRARDRHTASIPTRALIGLAVCALAVLALGVYAYLGATRVPWGEDVMPLFFLAGTLLSLYLLLGRRGTWPLRGRAYALLGLAVLACGLFIWSEAYRSGERLVPFPPIGPCGSATPPSSAVNMKAQCLTHVKFLALALSTYAVDNGAFPGPEQWQNAAALHLEVKNDLAELTTCPAAPDSALAYAYNAAVSGVMYSALDDPAHTVVLFESAAGRNVSTGGPGLLPAQPRHLGGDNYGFADGHVQWLARKRLGEDEHGDPIWAKEPVRDVIWEPVLKESEGEKRSPPDP